MIAPVLVAILFFIVFLHGVSPSSLGGDSGDIILSYFFGGVAHPPGYPLNTIFGWVLVRLFAIFTSKTFVFRANLVSAFYMSIACGLLYVLLKRVTKNSLISLIATGSLAFSTLFWLYAHSAEVFQLAIVLVLLSFNMLLVWLNDAGKTFNNKYLYLAFWFWGLAVFDHQTTALLAPVYIYVLFIERVKAKRAKGKYFKIILFFVLGVLPYVYDIWEGFKGNIFNWADTTSFSGFFRLITRADYGSFSATKELIGYTFIQRIIQMVWYLNVFRVDFSIIGVILFVAGIVYTFILERKYFWIFFMSWFLSGPFFLFYASFPLNSSFSEGVSERFILLSYTFIAIFIGFGIMAVFEVLKRFLDKFIKKKSLFQLMISSLLVFPLLLAYKNFHKADLSNYDIGAIYGQDFLNSANPPGIVFPAGDTPGFNMEVAYYIEKPGSDSSLILIGHLTLPSYRQHIMKMYPNLIYPDNFKSNKIVALNELVVPFILANKGKYPIYFSETLPEFKDYRLIWQGMVGRFYENSSLPSNDEISNNIKKSIASLKFDEQSQRGKYVQFFADQIMNDYKDRYYRSGKELLDRNQNADAIQLFKKALEIDANYQNAIFGLGVAYLNQKDCNNSQAYFNRLININSSYWQAYEGLAQVAEQCFGNNLLRDQYLQKSQDIRKKAIETPIS